MFAIQSLELRQLLATNPARDSNPPEAAGSATTATLRSDGTLEVFGTPSRDTISVDQDHRSPRIRVRATINSRAADDREIGNFRARDVKRIVVKGGNKDDRIDVTVAGDRAKTVEGGKGNDQLAVVGGNLHLVGGAGDDRLTANPDFQPRPDFIIGFDLTPRGYLYATNNHLEGGDGRDTLESVGGDDTLMGGRGEDVFNSLAGNVTMAMGDLPLVLISEKDRLRENRVALFGIETIKTRNSDSVSVIV